MDAPPASSHSRPPSTVVVSNVWLDDLSLCSRPSRSSPIRHLVRITITITIINPNQKHRVRVRQRVPAFASGLWMRRLASSPRPSAVCRPTVSVSNEWLDDLSLRSRLACSSPIRRLAGITITIPIINPNQKHRVRDPQGVPAFASGLWMRRSRARTAVHRRPCTVVVSNVWLDDLSLRWKLARSSPIRHLGPITITIPIINPNQSTAFVTRKGPSYRIGSMDAQLASSPPPSTVHRRCIQCVARRSFPALEACPQLADPMSSVNHNHNSNHQSQSKAPGSCPAKGPSFRIGSMDAPLASSHSRLPSTVHRRCIQCVARRSFPALEACPQLADPTSSELASAVHRPPSTVSVSNVWLDDLSLRSRLARSSPIRRLARITIFPSKSINHNQEHRVRDRQGAQLSHRVYGCAARELASTVHRLCIQCVARRSFPALEACPQLADPTFASSHSRLPSTVHRRCIQCVARRSFPALEACPQLADPTSRANHNHNPNHQSQSKAPGS